MQVGADGGADAAVAGQDHAGVTEAADAAEVDVPGPAEGLDRAGELADAVAAQLVGAVGGELGQLGGDDLALLAEGAGDDGDVGVRVGGVAGDHPAGCKGLVVGVGVDEDEPSGSGHGANIAARARLGRTTLVSGVIGHGQ